MERSVLSVTGFGEVLRIEQARRKSLYSANGSWRTPPRGETNFPAYEFSRNILRHRTHTPRHWTALARNHSAALALGRLAKETVMLKFLGGTVGFIFLVGLVVVVGTLMLIF